MNMSEEVIVMGNRNAMTDGLVALMVGRTAVLAALLNVKINLIEIKDPAYVDYMKAEVDEIEKLCLLKESEVLKKYGM
jgi:formiminotetrahydrofolate cyclodeaminase